MSIFDHRIDHKFEDAQVSISGMIAEKNELVTQVKGFAALPEINIRDREYITDKTKTMIERCEAMMTRLEKSFEPTIDEDGNEKENLSLYGVDVFAKLVNVTSGHIRELRELNKMVLGIDIVNVDVLLKKSEEEKSEKDKTVKLSSSDLLKLIKEAGKTSQLNAVEADFTVVNQNQPKESVDGQSKKIEP